MNSLAAPNDTIKRHGRFDYYVEYMEEKAAIKQAWGDFIGTLADWKWFVTLTLKPMLQVYTTVKERSGILYEGRERRVLASPGYDKPGWARAKVCWDDFVSRTTPALDDQVWVRMFEVDRFRGVPHIHGLVANVDPSVRRMDLVDWAWSKYGMARVVPYEAERGARFYLCKYVTKDIADVDFSSNLGTFKGYDG